MTDNNYKVSEVHLFYVNIIIPMSYRKTQKDKKVQTNDKEITNGLSNYYYPEIYSQKFKNLYCIMYIFIVDFFGENRFLRPIVNHGYILVTREMLKIHLTIYSNFFLNKRLEMIS